MAPTCPRTSPLISSSSRAHRSGEADGDDDSDDASSVVTTKAKGRWPLSSSGMPTTLASVTSGWLVMACSRVPVGVMGCLGQCVLLW